MNDWGTCVRPIPGTDVGVPTLQCFEVVYGNILLAVISLAVLALFVMLIMGGFKYLTSAGDQKATTAAKQTMTYAIGGIVLIVLAYLIFKLIEFYIGQEGIITRFAIPTVSP